MKFLTVAKVLIVNQLKSYRVHKFMLVFDVLLILSFLVVTISAIISLSIPHAGDSVRHVYSEITSYVSVRDLIIKISAGVSALLYLSALTGREVYAVTRDQYPILMHPVSFRDFIFGRIIAEAFAVAKFNVVWLWIFYCLTFVAGSVFSALLAFFVFIVGFAYLGLIMTLISLLKRFELFKALCLVLAGLSVLDFVRGTVTASTPIYVWIYAITGCYVNLYRLIPFVLSLVLSISVLMLISEYLTPEVEQVYALRREKEVENVKVDNSLLKTFVELKRMKFWIFPFLAIVTYPAGIVMKSVIPKTLAEMLPFYVMFIMLSTVDHVILQEAGLLWIYRTCNAVKEFAKNVILKAVAVYFFLLVPALAFVLSIKFDLVVIVELVCIILLISSIQSVGAVLIASKSRFKTTRILGVYNTQSVAMNVQFLYMVAEMVVIGAILLIVALFKFALVVLTIVSVLSLIVGIKTVERIALNVEVR